MWLIGGEDVQLRLPFVRALKSRGFPVTVCGTMNADASEYLDVAFQGYSMKRRLAPLADLGTFYQLRRLFRERKPDLVHAFDTKPGLLAPLAAGVEGVQVSIRTITGMGSTFSSATPAARLLQFVYRGLQRRVDPACQMTVFQNTDDQSYFLEHHLVDANRQMLISGSGVDTDHLATKAAANGAAERVRHDLGLGNRLVCMMVARLVREKGVLEFLKAAKIVRERVPEAAFILVGPSDIRGPNAVSIEEVRRYEHDVIYLGPRDDVVELLSVADVFVLPTRYREGVPRALLEAGAIGVPSVTTDMPGCRDVVLDGWNGFIFKPGDDQALAGALITLLEQPSLRREMGSRAVQRVREHFDISGVINAYAKLYSRLWGEARNE